MTATGSVALSPPRLAGKGIDIRLGGHHRRDQLAGLGAVEGPKETGLLRDRETEQSKVLDRSPGKEPVHAEKDNAGADGDGKFSGGAVFE
jgi:hypothetical protein